MGPDWAIWRSVGDHFGLDDEPVAHSEQISGRAIGPIRASRLHTRSAFTLTRETGILSNAWPGDARHERAPVWA